MKSRNRLKTLSPHLSFIKIWEFARGGVRGEKDGGGGCKQARLVQFFLRFE